MDHVAFRDLQRWLGSELESSEGVVVGFTGSYTSAVGMALLKRVYQKTIWPVFVCVKEDVWKLDLAEAWLTRLGVPAELQKLIFNETVDDLEDQAPALKRGREVCHSVYVRAGLNMMALSTGFPLVWLGDRNSVALHGLPSSQARTYAPLADLSHAQVRELGAFLSVDESWIPSWGGAPADWVKSERVRMQKLDRLVGWVAAHKEDIAEVGAESPQGDAVLRGSSNGFRWMGWVPDDAHDRVQIAEIIEAGKSSHAKPAQKLVTFENDVELLSNDYQLSLSGTPSSDLTVLGSVRVSAEVDLTGNLALRFTGIRDDGQAVSFGVRVQSEQGVDRLLKKLGSEERLPLPVRLSLDGEDVWFMLSLSTEGMRSLKAALEDLLAQTAILPDEIIDRPLTPEEMEERARRSERLANAPRPPSRRGRR